MGGVERFHGPCLGSENVTQDLAESIASVAHGQEFQFVVRAGLGPTFGDGFRRLSGGQRALEFVGYDEDAAGHGRADSGSGADFVKACCVLRGAWCGGRGADFKWQISNGRWQTNPRS